MNSLLRPDIYSPVHWLNDSTASRGRQSAAGSTISSALPTDEEIPKDGKSVSYQDAAYPLNLLAKGSFMTDHAMGMQRLSYDTCHTLRFTEQSYPQDLVSRPDRFATICQGASGRNESRVIRDILPLIVPSAETLAIHNGHHLKVLHETLSEAWNGSRPFCGPCPQPDYSVGFARSAFTDDQLEALQPYVGLPPNSPTSLFMGTWQMYFPFLTCEVECGVGELEIADRQNAHSMTLAVRGIVELFRLMKREMELHLQIVAFSISHNEKMVSIYGHYPLIHGNITQYHRHLIDSFAFTREIDKFTAYRFTKNVYDLWMPTHLERIRGVIDMLVIDQIEWSSQELGSHRDTNRSSTDASSIPEQAELAEVQGEEDEMSMGTYFL